MSLQTPQSIAAPFAPMLESVSTLLPDGIRQQYLIPGNAAYEVVLGGQMSRIWHRPFWIWPIFWLLSLGDVLFPETGQNIPTTLVIRPGFDGNGEPYATWERTFFFPHHRSRRYTSTMHYDERTGHIIELQGPREMFQEDAVVRFIPPATVEWETVRSVLRLGRLRIHMPRRLWIRARILQTADPERPEASHVTLTIFHGLLGPIFGYEGTFRTARHEPRLEDQANMSA